MGLQGAVPHDAQHSALHAAKSLPAPQKPLPKQPMVRQAMPFELKRAKGIGLSVYVYDNAAFDLTFQNVSAKLWQIAERCRDDH